MKKGRPNALRKMARGIQDQKQQPRGRLRELSSSDGIFSVKVRMGVNEETAEEKPRP